MGANDKYPGQDGSAAVVQPAFEPLDPNVLAVHRGFVDETRALVAAIAQLGFVAEDLGPLLIAVDSKGDVCFAITDELGHVVAIKRWFGEVDGETLEEYDDPSIGDWPAPCWVSPGAMQATDVLVVDGELNGMMAWCVRPELAVVGVPGHLGWLPSGLLEGRRVFILAEDDEEAGSLRVTWWLQAKESGAAHIVQLEALEGRGPLQVARDFGRDELRVMLP